MTTTTPRRRSAKYDLLTREIESQKDWMRSCGGSKAAYLRRYGAADAPDRSGNGGLAIWAADLGALHHLKVQRRFAARAR